MNPGPPLDASLVTSSSTESCLVVKALNLGPKSSAWLESAGITQLEDLQNRGAIEAFLDVEALGFKPSLNLLYALEGAISGRHWQQVRKDEGGELVLRLEMAREARHSE